MVDWQILMGGVIVFSALGSIIEKKTLFKEHAMEFSSVFAILMAVLSLTLIPLLDFSFPT